MWVSALTAAAPLPDISQSLCGFLHDWSSCCHNIVLFHVSLLHRIPDSRRLFCFWILVNVFILPRQGVIDLWQGVIDNICPISYLFTLRQEAGEGGGGGGGWVPFLKFTWTCVQTTWTGRAAFKVCESAPPRQTWFLDIAGKWQIPALNYALILRHICHTRLLLCYFTGSNSSI